MDIVTAASSQIADAAPEIEIISPVSSTGSSGSSLDDIADSITSVETTILRNDDFVNGNVSRNSNLGYVGNNADDDDDLSASMSSHEADINDHVEDEEYVQGPRRNRIGSSSHLFNSFVRQHVNEMDSTFAIQQFIQQNLPKTPTKVDASITCPSGQDEESWQYETMRQLCIDMNDLITRLLSACTPKTCADMKASEWAYLCSNHPQPNSCCAIDYITHTYDSAIVSLTSSKIFPSRISIAKGTAQQHISPLARRLYRVFAHAYFEHREVFQDFENDTLAYQRFTQFCIKYGLIQDKFLIIPKEAMGTAA